MIYSVHHHESVAFGIGKQRDNGVSGSLSFRESRRTATTRRDGMGDTSGMCMHAMGYLEIAFRHSVASPLGCERSKQITTAVA